jgi:uncharacterized protein YgiB involved in biofilm formation
MYVARRVAGIGLAMTAAFAFAALTAPTLAAAAPQPAVATDAAGDIAVASRHLVKCGDGSAAHRRCANARNSLIREGYQVSPLYHNAPDCTAPGCVPGWYFYYYQ